MSNKEINHKKVSKFLSYILRHNPGAIGLHLDENGWASVSELLDRLNNSESPITLEMVKAIVETNDKRRFVLSEDFSMIRANQGHSINVDLQLEQSQPPEILFHGTAKSNVESILVKGLNKQQRHHVHLSDNIHTARNVGSRHGSPVVLSVDAKAMYDDGLAFYKTANDVWLTENVPPQYLQIM